MDQWLQVMPLSTRYSGPLALRALPETRWRRPPPATVRLLRRAADYCLL